MKTSAFILLFFMTTAVQAALPSVTSYYFPYSSAINSYPYAYNYQRWPYYAYPRQNYQNYWNQYRYPSYQGYRRPPVTVQKPAAPAPRPKRKEKGTVISAKPKNKSKSTSGMTERSKPLDIDKRPRRQNKRIVRRSSSPYHRKKRKNFMHRFPFYNWNGGPGHIFDGSSKQPFGKPRYWFDRDDPKQGLEDMWDDLFNAPSKFGQMPGGWYAPSITVPNPIDVGDQLKEIPLDAPEWVDVNP